MILLTCITQTLTSVQLTMAAVMITRTVLTASAASLASVTQDMPQMAETHVKVVHTSHTATLKTKRVL